MIINYLIENRTNELANTIKDYNTKDERVMAATTWILASVLNTGVSLTINFSINPVFTPELLDALLPILKNNESIVVEDICDSAIKVQCAIKVQRIEKLNRIQKLMLELYEFDPALVEKGMPKLSLEEQLEIREVLTFEK